MKKSRFTDNQIIEMIKRVEAWLAVPELCWELGISSATACIAVKKVMWLHACPCQLYNAEYKRK